MILLTQLAKKACKSITTPDDLESIFYASSLSKMLGDNCKVRAIDLMVYSIIMDYR